MSEYEEAQLREITVKKTKSQFVNGLGKPEGPVFHRLRVIIPSMLGPKKLLLDFKEAQDLIKALQNALDDTAPDQEADQPKAEPWNDDWVCEDCCYFSMCNEVPEDHCADECPAYEAEDKDGGQDE